MHPLLGSLLLARAANAFAVHARVRKATGCAVVGCGAHCVGTMVQPSVAVGAAVMRTMGTLGARVATLGGGAGGVLLWPFLLVRGRA